MSNFLHTWAKPENRIDLRVRFYRAAFVLMSVLSLAACAPVTPAPSAATSATPTHAACYWPQSWNVGCHEIAELAPRG